MLNIRTLRSFLVKHYGFVIGVTSSFILSMTPLYATGYILFILIAALKINVLKAFGTYFARLVLAFLILLIAIMVTGVFTSFLDITNFAIINLTIACMFWVILLLLQSKPEDGRAKKFDVSDGISLIIAVAVPVILFIVHFSQGVPVSESLFKLVNADGWDSVSHLNFLQVTAENNNYFYSTSPMQEGNGLAAINYPQGWHLASSSFVNGLLPNVFNPVSYGVNATFIAYIAVVLFWYILTVYIFAKTGWHLLKRVPRSTYKLNRYVVFSLAMSVPILTVFTASIYPGYMNYLGVFPFIMVAVIASYEVLNSRKKSEIWGYLALTLLMSAGVCLEWVLPVPFVLFLMFVVTMTVGMSVREFFRRIPLVILGAVIAASLLGYLYILTRDVGVGHFYASNSWATSLPSISLAVTSLAVIMLGAIWRRPKKEIDSFVIIISPFLLYIFILWIFAYLFSGSIGYYHAKLFGIMFSVISLFATVGLVRLIESIDSPTDRIRSAIFAVVFSISAVAGVIIFSSQTIDLRLFQRSQYHLTPEERSYVVEWMTGEDSLKNEGQLLLLRKNFLQNNNRSMLYNRLTVDSAKRYLASQSPTTMRYVDLSYTCLMNIYYEKKDNGQVMVISSRHRVLDKLAICVQQRDSAGLPTTIRLPYSLKPLMEEVGISKAKFVYYGEERIEDNKNAD